MLRGGDVFNIKSEDADTGGIVVFSCRVLFWWEEQEIKYESVIKDPNTKFSYLDRSRMMKETVNAFLLSVDSGEGKIEKSDLDNGRWSSALVSSVIKPLYLSYTKATGSSYDQIRAFHSSVKAYYEKGARIGEYVPAPEIIEFNTIRSLGTLTLSDLRSLSYAEFMKYEIISEELKKKGGKKGGGMGLVGAGDKMPGMPTNLLADRTLSSAQVRSIVEGQ